MLHFYSTFRKISIFLFCLPGIFLWDVSEALSFHIDNIDIPEIREMQLRKDDGIYYIDVVMLIKNSGEKDIRLQNCNLNLAFAVENNGRIQLGKAMKDSVTLTKRNNGAGNTALPLTVALGKNIEKLHLDIISSDAMNSLLTASEPVLKLSVTGGFDAGILSKIGWTYEQDLQIDWILESKIPRKVLMDTYKAIETAADRQRKISPEQEKMEEDLILEEYRKSDKSGS